MKNYRRFQLTLAGVFGALLVIMTIMLVVKEQQNVGDLAAQPQLTGNDGPYTGYRSHGVFHIAATGGYEVPPQRSPKFLFFYAMKSAVRGTPEVVVRLVPKPGAPATSTTGISQSLQVTQIQPLGRVADFDVGVIHTEGADLGGRTLVLEISLPGELQTVWQLTPPVTRASFRISPPELGQVSVACPCGPAAFRLALLGRPVREAPPVILGVDESNGTVSLLTEEQYFKKISPFGTPFPTQDTENLYIAPTYAPTLTPEAASDMSTIPIRLPTVGSLPPSASATTAVTATIFSASRTPDSQSPTASGECGPGWAVISTNLDGTLSDVAAIAPNDIWAVGNTAKAASNTLTDHWDGSTWSRVASPNVGTSDNRLYAVEALAKDDIWAVGSYGAETGVAKPLLLHWNGKDWKVVPGPDPGPGSSALMDIEASASNDIWAVGGQQVSSEPGKEKSQTLTMHWNGTRWLIVPSPDPGTLTNTLNGISAISTNDVWAVGRYEQDQQEFVGFGKTLVIHWDGKSWTQVPSPNVQTWITYLSGVDALSASDVWAVGGVNGGEHIDPLTLHWNGSEWSIVPTPASTSHNGSSLVRVTAISSDNIWAAGGDNGTPFSMHWDGTDWKYVSTPAQSVDGKYLIGGLSGIAATSPAELWAVGGLQDGSASGEVSTSFVLRYSIDPCKTPQPTAGKSPAVRPLPTGPAAPAASVAVPTSSAQTTGAACWTWSHIADFDVGAKMTSIASVSAHSPKDIWAVGGAGPTEYGQPVETLALHWDGVTWTRVISPNVPSAPSSVLRAVGAISPNDVWAVGSYLTSERGDNSGRKTLAMHWDGRSWTIVPTPNSPPIYSARYHSLTGIAAISKNDVWAVGHHGYNETEGGYGDATFIIHWDGRKWSQVRSPNAGQNENVLRAVSFTSSGDIWAVGYYNRGSISYQYDTLTLHWDGKEWSIVPSPNIPGPNRDLTSNKLVNVTALSKDDVWSIGSYQAGTATYSTTYTTIQHWDGARWNVLVPGSRSIGSELRNFAAVAPNSIWALGPAVAMAYWSGVEWREVLKPDNSGSAPSVQHMIVVSPTEIMTIGSTQSDRLQVGHFVEDGGPCNAPQVRVIKPPTPTMPPPVPTSRP